MTKEVFEAGVHQISNDRYHASAGLSRSALWVFNELPYKYWHQYLSGNYEQPQESDACLVGNLLHTLVLEPHLFDANYYVMPACKRNTKQGKSDYEQALNQANGRTLVKTEQFELAIAMANAVHEKKIAAEILEGAVYERSIYWQDERTGLLCKARPDVWNGLLIGDLKTARDASYRGFQRAAIDEGYYLQAGMMYEATKSIGSPIEKVVFISVEKTKPYPVGVYMLDDDALQYGINLFHSILERYAECMATNEWPGYGVQLMSVPEYAKKEVM